MPLEDYILKNLMSLAKRYFLAVEVSGTTYTFMRNYTGGAAVWEASSLEEAMSFMEGYAAGYENAIG